MSEHMLSLLANPHDPFDDYEKWSMFDRKEGFNTEGLLARLITPSPDISQPDQDRMIEEAIDNIVANPSFAGLYKKVSSG